MASFWMIGRKTRSLNGASSSISSRERGVWANCDRRTATTSRPMRGIMSPSKIRPKATRTKRVRSTAATSHLDVHNDLDNQEANDHAYAAGDRQQDVGPAEEWQHIF